MNTNNFISHCKKFHEKQLKLCQKNLPAIQEYPIHLVGQAAQVYHAFHVYLDLPSHPKTRLNSVIIVFSIFQIGIITTGE